MERSENQQYCCGFLQYFISPFFASFDKTALSRMDNISSDEESEMREIEELDQAYEEAKIMQEYLRRSVDSILKEKDRLSNKLKNLRDKKESLPELKRQRLDEDKKKSASLEQKKTDDCKQKLQMEIQELKGKLQVMRHVEDEDDDEVKEKMKKMNEELEETCSELQDLEDMNRVLMIKQCETNAELHEGREALITGLRELVSDRTSITIKRMGELDEKPFLKACKERFTGEEADVQHAMLFLKWQESLKDPAWHPFKRVGTEDKMQVVVDEEDEQLRSLREEWGKDVKNAVKTALEELNEFNPSGGYSVPELWNLIEKRKATLKEVVEYMTLQIKNLKR